MSKMYVVTYKLSNEGKIAVRAESAEKAKTIVEELGEDEIFERGMEAFVTLHVDEVVERAEAENE